MERPYLYRFLPGFGSLYFEEAPFHCFLFLKKKNLIGPGRRPSSFEENALGAQEVPN